MREVISADLLKLRRNWIWWLILLLPISINGLLAASFLYFQNVGHDPQYMWSFAFDILSKLLPFLIFLIVPLLVSLLVGMEHQWGMWKQLLVMPIPKWKLYASKGVWILLSSQLVGLLLFLGLAFTGWLLTSQVELEQIMLYTYLPFLFAIPFTYVQLWLAMIMPNQAIPISLGIAGVFIGSLLKGWAWWTPWGFLTTYMPFVLPEHPMTLGHYDWKIWLFGLSLSITCFTAGMLHFIKKDFD